MLRISSLDMRFPGASGGFLALDGIDLEVGEHEVVALVGTSGCGKSTLLRIVSGLERPTGGEVRLERAVVDGPTSDVAMVFQEPRLMPWLSARENVRLALIGLPRRTQDERIDAALEQVGLSDFADALPRELSGGMAQRTALARALVRQPAILLLDEPFSALDSFTKLKLQDHLVSLWERSRFTLIMVTHDVEEAAVLADRIVVMRGQPGRIHEQIPVELPRPRVRTTVEIQQLKERINAALDLS
jgi:sulfonate transport system ATP-binding protein